MPEKIKNRIKVEKAEKKDFEVIKEIFMKSFENDPFTKWIVKQDEKRIKRTEANFETLIKNFGFRYGGIYTDSEKKGCVIYIPPGKQESNTFNNLLLLPAWIKVVGLNRMLQVMKSVSEVDKYQPGSEYLHFLSIGVHPSAQGQGIGSALLNSVLAVSDMRGIPSYLETSNEKNLDFYFRHGFEIRKEIDIPDTSLKVWILVRKVK